MTNEEINLLTIVVQLFFSTGTVPGPKNIDSLFGVMMGSFGGANCARWLVFLFLIYHRLALVYQRSWFGYSGECFRTLIGALEEKNTVVKQQHGFYTTAETNFLNNNLQFEVWKSLALPQAQHQIYLHPPTTKPNPALKIYQHCFPLILLQLG